MNYFYVTIPSKNEHSHPHIYICIYKLVSKTLRMMDFIVAKRLNNKKKIFYLPYAQKNADVGKLYNYR